MDCETYITPFLVNDPILSPLKTPQNQMFSGVFRGYKMGTLARNRLRVTLTTQDLNTTSQSRSNIATTSQCHNIAMTLQWQSYEICSLEINFSFLIIASVAVFAATWANFQPKA